ncbi:MAG: magnesium transporter [Melioribacteraceae bacterium]|nr:magnesium transporter [Melioribacteraceae bacterium]
MSEENELTNIRTVLQIDNELIDNITTLIKSGAEKSLLNIFADLHPADIAEIINHIDRESGKYAFSLLDTETAGDVITEIDENLREKILKDIDVKTITDIVDELYTDDATDIVSDLPDTVAKQVLKNIDQDDSEDVQELLKYPEDTAGGIMTSNFVSVDSRATIKDAIAAVRNNAEEFDHIYHIYVLKENEELLGIVSLKSLLINPLKKKVKSVIQEDLMFVTPDVDQEEVANIMQKYDLVAIPVVDEHRRMLGRITFDDIQDVIEDEASEDIQKIAGLTEEEESSDSVFKISKIRLPWLIVALLMELLAALVLRGYENYIQEIFIATFFIPVVMAMGGSTGTQAAIVMVRGLSSGDIWINESVKSLVKEFSVAILNGIVLSSILYVTVILIFPRNELSTSFALLLSGSLMAIIVTATIVGASIPLILKKLNTDPAIATGPFVTTSNDILGLLIYLTIIIVYFF